MQRWANKIRAIFNKKAALPTKCVLESFRYHEMAFAKSSRQNFVTGKLFMPHDVRGKFRSWDAASLKDYLEDSFRRSGVKSAIGAWVGDDSREMDLVIAYKSADQSPNFGEGRVRRILGELDTEGLHVRAASLRRKARDMAKVISLK